MTVGAALFATKTCRKCGATFIGERCKPCWAAYMRAWGASNRDKVRANNSKKHAAHRESDNERSRQWRLKNSDKAAQHWKAFHEANKHREAEWNRRKRIKNKDKNNATRKLYDAENPGFAAARDAARRAAKKQATPSWANSFFTREAYVLAKLREKVCGGKWHVDHIFPLQSHKVCGLHVEHNLQVIPASHNLAKSNSLSQEWLSPVGRLAHL